MSTRLSQSSLTRSAGLRLLLPFVLGLFVATLFPMEGWGQQNQALNGDHVTWKVLTPVLKGKPGDKVEVKFQANLKPQVHLYTTKKYPDTVIGPSPTEMKTGGSKLLSKAGSLRANKGATKKMDPNFEIETEYWSGNVVFTVPFTIGKNATIGSTEKAWVNLYYQTCDDNSCKPPLDDRFDFTVQITEDTAAVAGAAADSAARADSIAAALAADSAALADSLAALAAADSADSANAAAPGDDTAVVSAEDAMTIQDQIEKKKKEGLISYLLFAMGFGFIALGTPCVFPMIPITISFFTKREHNNRAHAVRDASIYALGIILTFTALGAVVAAIYGAAGVNDMATNPWVNLFIAGIFLTFALSLFGLFEIQIPSGILNALNAKANQGGGISSILLMGFVFSLTSFTCTVPFVGPALTSVGESGEWFWPIAGMAAFAFAFSLPFFLLALFPSLLKAMPKSGGWLNAVKVTMGFVEIAAAMKFLSNADLVWAWGILTREIVLAVWISVSLLTSLYLLGRFKLPHDTPIEKIGVVRMLFSMGSLAIAFWLLTGLLGAPLGEADAFLPPQEYPGKGNTSLLASIEDAGGNAAPQEVTREGWVAADGMQWIQDDYDAALAESKRTGKPIFVDFTGYTCTNCRWMERNVFTRDDVRDLMNRFVLARLYTDRREESNQRNRQMQIDRFKTIDLPYYVVISPDDKVIGQTVFTRDVDGFKGFLTRGLKNEDVMAIR